jgi:putative NADH-flavin reductase
MKILLLGATGRVGSRMVKELVLRGHQVVGVARHTDKAEPQRGVTWVQADVLDPAALARTLNGGYDVVIHSVKFLSSDVGKIIAAVKKAGVPRLMVVGGAGSLQVSPGHLLVDTPDFPAAYKQEASAGVDFLNALRAEKELNWTLLSPGAELAPGERTGHFRLGKDQLLIAADGRSHISMEDYVIALADEMEKPQHIRERFAVAY